MSNKNICSFCGEAHTEENPVIHSAEESICKACAETALTLMKFKTVEMPAAQTYGNEYTPSDLKKILDDYVIGQEDAKKVLSVAVYNHIKRINNPDKKIDKTNVLFVGPTGSGKTYLAQTIAKHLDIPLAIADATSLTAAGYVGEDVENVITKLYNAADGDIDKVERGIIFIDEIDKISKMGEGRSTTRDVGGESVQQALLKIIEGSKVLIPTKGGRKHPSGQDQVEVDTSNILFIVGGAFADLRDNKKIKVAALGSAQEAKKKTEKEKIDAEDIIKFGIIPELMGRLHLISELNEISEDAMVKILTEPKDSVIKQYERLFEIDDVQLKFTDVALHQIAKEAMKRKTGARALRSVVENIMIDVMFNLPSYRDQIVTIDFKGDNFVENIDSILKEAV